MTDGQTVEYLNRTVWCKLAPSPIHGIGVFAIRDIPKGQKMWCIGADRRWLSLIICPELEPEIKKLIVQRWPIAANGQLFMSPNDDARLLSFMNHSSSPNYDKFTDTALRDIKKGEEVLEDYEYQP